LANHRSTEKNETRNYFQKNHPEIFQSNIGGAINISTFSVLVVKANFTAVFTA
jgi:hypothetical protein